MRVGQIAVCRRRGGAGGGGGSAPAISASGLQIWNGSTGVTSAAGIADPPQLIHVIPADAAEGDSLWVELDSNTPPNPASGDYRLEQRILLWDGTLNSGAGGYALADPGTFAPHNFTIQTGLNPAKHWYGRNWIERNYGDATSTPVNKSAVADFTITAAGITTAWNPADKSTWGTGMTLTNGNATVSAVDGGANHAIRSTGSLVSGKLFGSFIINAEVGAGLKLGFANAAYGNSGSIASVGDTLANFSDTFWVSGQDLSRGNDGSVNGSFVATVFATMPVSGDRIDWVIDFGDGTNGTAWFGLNGDFSHHGDPVAETGGYAIPIAGPLKLLAVVCSVTDGDVNRVSIDSLGNANTHKPTGCTPVGA